MTRLLTNKLPDDSGLTLKELGRRQCRSAEDVAEDYLERARAVTRPARDVKGLTTWMAGGGVKGGFQYGATDEVGYEAVVDKVHIHDWQATILLLLGLDHERLTFRHAGRDMRLTDVRGRVHEGMFA